jgi:membrane protease YdiL (CAAX protease family)
MEAETSGIETTAYPGPPGGDVAVLEDGPPVVRSIPLTGWLERQGFHPIMSAFLMFVLSFVLFQGLASLIAIAFLIMDQGLPEQAELLEVLETATGPLLMGNTIGQFVGMAIPVLLWSRLHTRDSAALLRISHPDMGLTALSVLALVALLPAIQWLGQINASLPIPEFFVELERAQLELIETILKSDIALWSVVFALAVTPAICEELLFRGYLQRQLERALGVTGGIVATGLLFGLYHFRLSQALPLAVLGIFLGWLVWRTGSLWVPILIHFLNNALAIVAANLAAANPEWGVEDLEHIPVPWPALVGGTLLFAGIVAVMNRRVALADVSRTG